MKPRITSSRRPHGGLAAIGLCALLASGPTAAEGPRAEQYTPIYLMYSGTPSTAQLADLREFLEAQAAPAPVVRDTIETVVYKLAKFKAGFAYPVYVSEHGKTGNACVVAESDHQRLKDGVGLLASPRIVQHLLHGRLPPLALDEVANQIVHHELFHCHDMLKLSLYEVGLRVLADGPAYFAYRGEAGADAYAALVYLRAGGDKRLLRQIRDFRTLNLLNGDAVHFTARTLDHIIWRYDQRSLRGLSTGQLLRLAEDIRDATAFSATEFASVEQAAQRFEQAFLARTARPGPVADTVPVVGANPQLEAELFAQVRTALYGLGGEIGPNNAVFHGLAQQFQLPAEERLATRH